MSFFLSLVGTLFLTFGVNATETQFKDNQTEEQVRAVFAHLESLRSSWRKKNTEMTVDQIMLPLEKDPNKKIQLQLKVSERQEQLRLLRKEIGDLVFQKEACRSLSHKNPSPLFSFLHNNEVWTFCKVPVATWASDLCFFLVFDLKGNLKTTYQFSGEGAKTLLHYSGRKLGELMKQKQDGDIISSKLEETDLVMHIHMIGHGIDSLELFDLRDSKKNKLVPLAQENLAR